VRGKGLMNGTDFIVGDRPERAKPLVKEIVRAAEERDLLLLSCGTYDNTVRWIPPLNVTEAQINAGLKIFEEALHEVVQ
jgi:4-aminobutyrate aminotransferase-like enzyme